MSHADAAKAIRDLMAAPAKQKALGRQKKPRDDRRKPSSHYPGNGPPDPWQTETLKDLGHNATGLTHQQASYVIRGLRSVADIE